MTAFMVVDTLLKDPELYEQYKLLAKPLVEKFGGQYLARGGKMSVKENALWTPTRMVLVMFPSSDHIEAFYNSEEYQKVLAISKQSADRTVFSLEGM
jgi:uncharacterized protein (DUF1330 family)